MTFYLDNNIVVEIEYQESLFNDLLKIIKDGEHKSFYSSAHIFEADRFVGNCLLRKSDFLMKRFETLREISDNKYLFCDFASNDIIQIIEEPRAAYNTITELPLVGNFVDGFTNILPQKVRLDIRNYLGLDSRELNNYSPEQIVEFLGNLLSKYGVGQSFTEFVEQTILLNADAARFGLDNRIAVVFELLDLFGHWTDKSTKSSNYARLFDASHCFFASYCDYFISDDLRTRKKAEVAYYMFNIRTKVTSSFPNILVK